MTQIPERPRSGMHQIGAPCQFNLTPILKLVLSEGPGVVKVTSRIVGVCACASGKAASKPAPAAMPAAAFPNFPLTASNAETNKLKNENLVSGQNTDS